MRKVDKLNIYNKSTLSIDDGKQMTLDLGCNYPLKIPTLTWNSYLKVVLIVFQMYACV